MRRRRAGPVRKKVPRVRRAPVRFAVDEDEVEALFAGGGDDKGDAR
jgi:hypothetical protein